MSIHAIMRDLMSWMPLRKKYNISISESGHKALFGKGMIGGQKVILAKPQTFMNLSGESVAELLHYYEIDPEEELLVIFDDISLAPGNIRNPQKRERRRA